MPTIHDTDEYKSIEAILNALSENIRRVNACLQGFIAPLETYEQVGWRYIGLVPEMLDVLVPLDPSDDYPEGVWEPVYRRNHK